MARSVKPSKRGKTAKFYAKTAESRAKHSKDNSNGGKSDKPKSYQREHMKAQRALGTQGTNKDVVKYIAYVFTPIQGYSKFGKYVGNANNEGPFVYTGFKVKWLMVKNASGVDNWALHDATRNPSNGNDGELFPNENYAESTGTVRFDFLSNGFKVRHTGSAVNDNGDTIVYMAFAEHPFASSTGTPATGR